MAKNSRKKKIANMFRFRLKKCSKNWSFRAKNWPKIAKKRRKTKKKQEKGQNMKF